MIRRIAALLGAGLVFAACGSISATSAMSKWVSDSNYAYARSVLTTDAHQAATVLRRTSSTSNDLHTVCAVLLLDVNQANASLPTPDDGTTNLLSTAYTKFGAGANECYVAAQSRSARSRAIASLELGAAALSEATARIDASLPKS